MSLAGWLDGRFEPFYCNAKYFCHWIRWIQWKHLGITEMPGQINSIYVLIFHISIHFFIHSNKGLEVSVINPLIERTKHPQEIQKIWTFQRLLKILIEYL